MFLLQFGCLVRFIFCLNPKQHHSRVSSGPLEGVGGGKTWTQHQQRHPRPRPRPLDLSSSPPWFPAGPEHQTQWARHRRQRRNSAGYTFTDLAEIVCRNIKDGGNDDDEVALR